MDLLANVLNGVQEDCENLLLKYEKLKSVRFTDFSELWKELNFAGIYGNKQMHEIIVFVPEVLFMVKQYFIKAESFNLKVGALYLLYGLYYKQPLKAYKKILITRSDWLVMKEFIEEIKENEHFDTYLIMFKLITDNAFFWSATNYTKSENFPQKYFHYGLFYTNSLVDDATLENHLQELKDVEEQYLPAKNTACEQSDNTAYKESINFCSNISEELLYVLNYTDDYCVKNESDISCFEENNIGKRRKLLKSRCFQDKVSPTKSSSD